MGEVWAVKLRFTPKAASDLATILDYISVRSPQGAQHVRGRLHTLLTLLQMHPHAGQLTSKGRVRRIVATPYPYLIFYRIRGDEIVIHGVRHSARDPSSMPE
ncbi:type II toxin-antitoxin system RelE/ParE family toxin [Beijerinckia sp. L45]|uniref:type II toxin-antitoxin system RelE/ParE family toxin n=1 Tax=Beijerinckia sp. L45 TaxID=1641855 RepID=UPI001FEDB23F|nr:type II toxin-antitoxin system RelE/ParE family toxin [Beijerinckia sp. L45]